MPSNNVHLPNNEGGMGVRNLWDLYKEINISDFNVMINYQDKNSLYHKTGIQRLKDITEKIRGWNNLNIFDKRRYNKNWIIKALYLMKEDNIQVYNNKLEFYHKWNPNQQGPSIQEYTEEMKIKKLYRKQLEKWQKKE
jgi:hypothetical protein